MHLKLNSDKTECIFFRSQAQHKKISAEPLNSHGDLIETSKLVRYLGGFLDQQLNFTQNIQFKSKKAMTNLIKILATQMYLTVQTCTTLVLMLWITHLNYANAILYGLPQSTLGKYQTIQNMCAKLVLNRKKCSRSSLVLKELNWPPIEQRIKYKILTSTFKCITGTALKYLQDVINKKNRRDNMHPNNNRTTLQRPKVKYKAFSTRSFKYSAPTLWNQLPRTIRESPNLDNFKKKLKIICSSKHST